MTKSPRGLQLRTLALALFSAFLLAAAIPNEFFRFGLPPLGFIALVPLYFAVLESSSHRVAGLLVGAFGAFLHALSSYWLWFFHDFRFWTLGSTTIAYFIVYYVLGLYLSLFLKQSGKARPLAFAILWAAFEYNKSVGFLGYPWGLIPYSLTEALPLLQIADITGVYGISALLALANAALAEFLVLRGGEAGALGAKDPIGVRSTFPLPPAFKLGYAGVALVLVLAAGAYGIARMNTVIPEIGSIDAVLVQQNIDPWEGGEDLALAANVALAKKALAKSETKPDLVIFSETSLQRPYNDFQRYFSEHPRSHPLIPYIRSSGSWLLTGAPIYLDYEKNEATNSVILIDPRGKQVQDYAKMHPVPFAEAVPFWEYAAFRNFMQKVVGYSGGWTMGTEYKIFTIPTKGGTLSFGAPICFEDAFSSVCRGYLDAGADLLVNLTNDSWSRTISAEIQHWAAARFRSIEFRRTLVRSTNGGLTCVVGPYGEILSSLPLFEAEALRTEIPVYKAEAKTVYFAFGDWFARSALLLCALWSIILMAKGAFSPVRRRR